MSNTAYIIVIIIGIVFLVLISIIGFILLKRELKRPLVDGYSISLYKCLFGKRTQFKEFAYSVKDKDALEKIYLIIENWKNIFSILLIPMFSSTILATSNYLLFLFIIAFLALTIVLYCGLTICDFYCAQAINNFDKNTKKQGKNTNDTK